MDILIVDDQEMNLLLVSALVEQLTGCTPHTHASPHEALAEAKARQFDVVITDYEMPGLNGIALIRSLRALPNYGDVPMVMVTARHEREVLRNALEAGATEFLTKPFEHIEFTCRLKNLVGLRAAQNQLREQAKLLAHKAAHASDMLALREVEIVSRLSRASEQRDNETGNHILRMATLCRLIGEGLGLDGDTCQRLFLAAPMHDVGKIGVPDAILLKPGRLEAEEREIMQRHVVLGHEILAGSSSELIQLAAEIALSHHERWDGKGYPHGLRGTAIPLCGRIAAVADVCDALASERPYKRAWSLAEIRTYLDENAGSQFDPACVGALLQRWPDVLVIYGETQLACSAA
jgi:putative two-component system response regulator